LSHFTIIELNSIDSTNNYAMQLIDANKAYSGVTIVAQTQTGGKGQRGKAWVDKPGESLLMSIILTPKRDIREQFVFNAAVAVAIAKVLQKLYSWQIHIKWPNDIIVNDKKAGGILIENVLRGSSWTHSVVGIGINMMQDGFPAELPYAISLKMASGKDIDLKKVRSEICDSILSLSDFSFEPQTVMEEYNMLLYKIGKEQLFSDDTGVWEASIVGAHSDGTIELQKEGGHIVFYRHGQAEWIWEQAPNDF
jgi:BirA family transcriptional regulator, biotin operon repressor / biotin---[acetyl-CoA-carboxylase] ligase